MILLLNYQRIHLNSQVPAGWDVIRIMGSSVASWQGSGSIVMIENIVVNSFSIWVVRAFLQSPENMELRLQNAEPYFSFCLEGYWQINYELQHVDIKKNQYQLLYSDAVQFIPAQVSGRMNQLLVISSSTNDFPSEDRRICTPVNASALMMDLILQLTQTSYFPKPRPFHEKLIRDIFTITEENFVSAKFSSEKFATPDLEALYKVSVFIENNLQQHHSIAWLAIYSGLNRQKLTSGFKSLFGKTIYAYCLEKRMQLAKTLLVNSHQPLKLVAQKAGYHNATNFSIAFRKFYGITPGQMRRKKPC